MRALITGIGGFVGSHLTEYLIKNNIEVWGTVLPGEKSPSQSIVCTVDITQPQKLKRFLVEAKPDYLFHLAAQSSVQRSWHDTAYTINANLLGTIHLLDAVRDLGQGTKILLVSSGEVYGNIKPEDLPVNEEYPPHPRNPYALSKMAVEIIGQQYARAYGLNIVIVRPFNHSGPGQQKGFVIPDFTSQLVEIEHGRREPILKVGNLEAKRDFLDVRDIVRAYLEIIEKGRPGSVYNVGSGRAISIRYLLDCLLSMSRVAIDVIVDQSLYRPLEILEIYADISKICLETGWQPTIPIEKTLSDTLEYWRRMLKC